MMRSTQLVLVGQLGDVKVGTDSDIQETQYKVPGTALCTEFGWVCQVMGFLDVLGLAHYRCRGE
ncbi:hypothetical protein A5320_03810 [Rheinheimera sp. SA_1]|nr:hypothetical protein A5320_03810 [Rheinheimera sp. SA_1]